MQICRVVVSEKILNGRMWCLAREESEREQQCQTPNVCLLALSVRSM